MGEESKQPKAGVFGKLAPREDPRTLKLAHYLLPDLPPAPSHYNALPRAEEGAKQPDPTRLFPMLGNDRYGCHDSKTEVLTANGWQPWPAYDGSPLATMNQATGLMEFQPPLAVQRYEHNGPMHFADHKRLDFALTPEHRMFIRPYVIPDHHSYVPGTAGYGAYRFAPISALPTRVALPAAPTGYIGAELKAIKVGSRVWNGDDFLALVALVISDGWVGGTDSNWSIVSFCCFRDDRREKVAQLADRLSISEVQGRRGVWKFSDGALADWFRANAYTEATYKSGCKCVPGLVKAASANQIVRFLDFFGDQSITAEGHRAFYSSSTAMIDDLQELLLRVGKRSGIYSRPQRDGGHSIRGRRIGATEGHLDITLNEWADGHDLVTLQRISRNPTQVVDHYRGEVFCATVPNSTLITRRNGQVLVSGNCCTIAAAAHAETLWESYLGKRRVPTRKAVLDDYFALTGGDDTGLVMLDVCNHWRKVGITGEKILAFAGVDRRKHDLIRQSVWLFGGVYLGFVVQQTAISDFQARRMWTPGPRTNSGHCVWVYAYSPDWLAVLTWGSTIRASWDWFDQMADESFAVLPGEGTLPGFTPGVDYAALKTDLEIVSA